MGITTSYRHSSRRPGDRFVRRAFESGGYAWCIRCADDHRYDVAQGFCDAEDLPKDIREAADSRFGFSPSYVRWPNDNG